MSPSSEPIPDDNTMLNSVNRPIETMQSLYLILAQDEESLGYTVRMCAELCWGNRA